MPSIQISHSFSRKGRITINASNIQIIKVREGKKRKEAIPSARPILKIVPFAFCLLYILNNPTRTNNKNSVDEKRR